MIAKRIDEGCEYPTGYGFAYRDWMRNQAVCYPVGLNWLAGVIHEAWIRLSHGPFHNADRFDHQLIMAHVAGHTAGTEQTTRRLTPRIQSAFDDGVRIGRGRGWRAACDHMDQQISARPNGR